MPGVRPVKIYLELMREEHLDQVSQIEQVSFPIPWSRQSFAQELQNGYTRYVVAVNDAGQVAGYGGMWLTLDEAQITNVAVHPEQRGKNVGKLLMLGLIQQATLSGCRKMTLEVASSNLIARRLYESFGFTAGGIRKKYYEHNGDDAIIMWLNDI